MRSHCRLTLVWSVWAIAFFGPSTLGGSDITQGGKYDQIIQALMQQFPGLKGLQGGGAAQGPGTMQQLGYTSPGINLYSGQGANIYGGLGLFEGSGAGQPESVTAGLATGALGKSSSQTPIANTGQLQQPFTSPSLVPLGYAGGGAGQPQQSSFVDQGGGGGSGGSIDVGGTLQDVNRISSLFNTSQTFPQASEPGFQAQRAGERQDFTAGVQGPANITSPTWEGGGQAFSPDVWNALQAPFPAATGSTPYPGIPSEPSMNLPGLLEQFQGTGGGGGGAPMPPTTSFGDWLQGLNAGGYLGTAADIAGGVAGLYGLYQGIQSGNAPQAMLGALGTYGGVAGASNALLGTSLPTISNTLFGAGAATGAEAGAAGAEAGLGTAGTAASGIAAGALATFGAPLAVMAIADMINSFTGEGPYAQAGNWKKEAESLAKDFPGAFNIMQQFAQLPQSLQEAGNDPAKLSAIANQARYILDQAPVISRSFADSFGPYRTNIDHEAVGRMSSAAVRIAGQTYVEALNRLQGAGQLAGTNEGTLTAGGQTLFGGSSPYAPQYLQNLTEAQYTPNVMNQMPWYQPISKLGAAA